MNHFPLRAAALAFALSAASLAQAHNAWLRVSLADGEAEYERTDRGWISYLNDLQKGRNTGAAWSWFIDIFAAATVVFSITGLFILKMHAGNRPFTWPMVGMGLVIPVLLALLFIH